jgi:hypothetical protein
MAAIPCRPRWPIIAKLGRAGDAGGILAIHDVFPNPADGGRPPHEIYKLALHSGLIPRGTGSEELADFAAALAADQYIAGRR